MAIAVIGILIVHAQNQSQNPELRAGLKQKTSSLIVHPFERIFWPQVDR